MQRNCQNQLSHPSLSHLEQECQDSFFSWKDLHLTIFVSNICKEQNVGSAFKYNFKPRFRVYKSDAITGKDRGGVAKHFLTKCTNGKKVENIEVQLIEKVQESNYNLEGKLWCRKKYWQAQLFTPSHGVNSTIVCFLIREEQRKAEIKENTTISLDLGKNLFNDFI